MEICQTSHNRLSHYVGVGDSSVGALSPDGSKIAIPDVSAWTINVYATNPFALLTTIGGVTNYDYQFTKNGRYIICVSVRPSVVMYFYADTGKCAVRKTPPTPFATNIFTFENDDADGGSSCAVFSRNGIFVCTVDTDWTIVFEDSDVYARITGAVAKNMIAAYVDDTIERSTSYPVRVWTAIDRVWTLTHSFKQELNKIKHVDSISFAGSWIALYGEFTVCWSLTSKFGLRRAISNDDQVQKKSSYYHNGVVYRKESNDKGGFSLVVFRLVERNVIYRVSTVDPCPHASTFAYFVVSDNGHTLCGVSPDAVTLFDIAHRKWSTQTHRIYNKYVRMPIQCLLFLNMRPELRPSVLGMLPFELYVLLCEYVAASYDLSYEYVPNI